MLKFVRKQLPRRFLRACGAILQLGCLKVALIHQLSGWCLEKTRFWSRVLNGASGELKPLAPLMNQRGETGELPGNRPLAAGQICSLLLLALTRVDSVGARSVRIVEEGGEAGDEGIFEPSSTFLLPLCRYSEELVKVKTILVFQSIDHNEMCRNMQFLLQKSSPPPS